MKKINFKQSIAFGMALSICLGLTACGGKKNVADGSQDLEVYSVLKGYDIKWIEKALENFQKEDWVKTKYPELKVDFSYDDSYATAHSKLKNGKNYNTTDLIFSEALHGYAGAGNALENLTESVYKSQVPGEDITVEEKMISGIRENYKYGKESFEAGENVYYIYPYTAGTNGIIYNATLMKEMNEEIPLTTDQFVAACDRISNLNNATYNKGYAIQANANDGYWDHMFPIWWAQYSGMNKYSDFYYGLVGNSQSPDVFKDEGRLESLKVFEQIFMPNKDSDDFGYNSKKDTYKYMNSNANAADNTYIQAQTSFLLGAGVFHVNGDWFVTEMHNTRKELTQDYEFAFMRTPVISSIIKVLPDKSVQDDAELAALIKAIDAGDTALKGNEYEVTQKDYDRVKEARAVVQAGNGTAVIPNYASAKAVAIDFLRYMATDKCILSTMEVGYGLSLPFYYDYKSVNNYEEKFEDIHRSRMDIFYSDKITIAPLPSEDSFPYGIERFYYYDMEISNLEKMISSLKTTAQTIFDNEVHYWDNAGTKWAQIIAGGV